MQRIMGILMIQSKTILYSVFATTTVLILWKTRCKMRTDTICIESNMVYKLSVMSLRRNSTLNSKGKRREFIRN